jgi:hypothetical protein
MTDAGIEMKCKRNSALISSEEDRKERILSSVPIPKAFSKIRIHRRSLKRPFRTNELKFHG